MARFTPVLTRWLADYRRPTRRPSGHAAPFRPRCEPLEERCMPDATLYNQVGFVVTARSDGVQTAAPIEIRVDGVAVTTADQLVFQTDATGAGSDLREYFLIDTNGFFRLRHFDISASPG